LGDAPPTFIEEVAAVAFAPAEMPDGHTLILPWRFPARVEAVSVGGAVLDASEYQAQPKAALLARLGRPWGRHEVVITIRSGWTLDKVPSELRGVVVELVRLRWHGKDRDPTIRSYESPDVETITYFDPDKMVMRGGLPADIANRLSAYCSVVIA
jgi:hypothetical protein